MFLLVALNSVAMSRVLFGGFAGRLRAADPAPNPDVANDDEDGDSGPHVPQPIPLRYGDKAHRNNLAQGRRDDH